jgi:heme-degrading monooxygenase HmoA
MIVMMNVLRARPGCGQDVERAFDARERLLSEFEGFAGFELLRRDEDDEYISLTRWESMDAFEQWMSSEHFARAHSKRHRYGEIVRGTELRRYELLDVEAPAIAGGRG